METCKTCKWWDKSHSQLRYEATEAGVCTTPKVDIDEEGYEAVKGNVFGLDYPVCDLITGPDFGCVLHEPQERP